MDGAKIPVQKRLPRYSIPLTKSGDCSLKVIHTQLELLWTISKQIPSSNTNLEKNKINMKLLHMDLSSVHCIVIQLI